MRCVFTVDAADYRFGASGNSGTAATCTTWSSVDPSAFQWPQRSSVSQRHGSADVASNRLTPHSTAAMLSMPSSSPPPPHRWLTLGCATQGYGDGDVVSGAARAHQHKDVTVAVSSSPPSRGLSERMGWSLCADDLSDSMSAAAMHAFAYGRGMLACADEDDDADLFPYDASPVHHAPTPNPSPVGGTWGRMRVDHDDGSASHRHGASAAAFVASSPDSECTPTPGEGGSSHSWVVRAGRSSLAATPVALSFASSTSSSSTAAGLARGGGTDVTLKTLPDIAMSRLWQRRSKRKSPSQSLSPPGVRKQKHALSAGLDAGKYRAYATPPRHMRTAVSSASKR